MGLAVCQSNLFAKAAANWSSQFAGLCLGITASNLRWDVILHYSHLGSNKKKKHPQSFPTITESFWSRVQALTYIFKASHEILVGKQDGEPLSLILKQWLSKYSP